MLNKQDKILVVILVAIGFALYGNTFSNDFLFDDHVQVTDNQDVKDFNLGGIFTTSISSGGGSDSSFYRPIVTLSFAIDYYIWADNPVGFHFVNIVLHILSTILVYLIFLSLQPNKTASFLTALLFLVHPLQVESVTYISGRTDLMPIFFMLLSLFLFIPVFYGKDKKYIFYTLALVSFIMALLSKELSVIFPALLVIVYFSFITKELNWPNVKNITLKIVPFMLFVVGYVLLRSQMVPFTGAYNFYQEPLGRILSFLKVLLMYWGILLFPYNLRSRLDHAFPLSIYSPEVLASLFILALIIYFSIRSFVKGERKIFFGFGWFFVSLAPASGIIIPLFSIITEHWLRMPSVGFFYLFSMSFIWLYNNLKNRSIFRNILMTSLVIYLIFLSVTTVTYNLKWKDPITYFEHIKMFYPDDWIVYANLALAHDEFGNKEKALESFKKVTELNPDNPAAHDNLASFYFNHGQFDLAIEEYRKAIEVDKSFVKPYQPLAQIYVNRKQYNEAIIYLEQLIQVLPDSWKPYSLMGDLYLIKGDRLRARESFKKSLEIEPDNEHLKNKLEKIRN